ncbi:MAG: hypothetical protein ACJARL_001838 [Halopseudomonas sp.]|jgi:hypothetical protein
MRVKGIFVVCASMYFYVGSSMASEGWTVLSSVEGGYEFSIKNGSFSSTQTKAGSEIALVAGRAVSPEGAISIEQWYVTAEDCNREMGNLVTLTVDGDFSYETTFAFGAGSAASAIAQVICGANSLHLEASQRKGI